MQNLDYWNTFVGEESPEAFMRNYGSPDPELCVARFLEERGQLYGVVNQGTWVKTFDMPEQHHCLTVKVYLLSYLEDTRDQWLPSLEATPPATPRRYREKFDPDRFPPPGTAAEDSPADEAGTYGTYIPESDHDFGDAKIAPAPVEIVSEVSVDESGVSFEEFEPDLSPVSGEGENSAPDDVADHSADDVVVPETDAMADENLSER